MKSSFSDACSFTTRCPFFPNTSNMQKMAWLCWQSFSSWHSLEAARNCFLPISPHFDNSWRYSGFYCDKSNIYYDSLLVKKFLRQPKKVSHGNSFAHDVLERTFSLYLENFTKLIYNDLLFPETLGAIGPHITLLWGKVRNNNVTYYTATTLFILLRVYWGTMLLLIHSLAGSLVISVLQEIIMKSARNFVYTF